LAKILVTGGAGFIGSHVARYLVEMGHTVIVLDDLSGGFEENVPENAELIIGSITDEACIKILFEKYHFEYVYHLAAYAAEGLSHFIRKFNYTNNLIGSVNLINQSVIHEVECFVFTSSIAVYGTNQLPMHEDLVPRPEDPYGIAKLAVEQDLKAAKEMFGLQYVIFRPHNVYGENQNIGDQYRNVVGIFMNQIMQKRPMKVFGDGTQTRAFSYIGDVAPIIAQAAFHENAYGETFNIGANTPYSINELAHAVAKAMRVKPQIDYLPARNEVLHAYACHNKVIEVFGVPTETSLDEGLERMAIWAKEVGSRKSKSFGDVEIERNLPGVWMN
jgi:UDP-glucose 4-epimerase